MVPLGTIWSPILVQKKKYFPKKKIFETCFIFFIIFKTALQNIFFDDTNIIGYVFFTWHLGVHRFADFLRNLYANYQNMAKAILIRVKNI